MSDHSNDWLKEESDESMRISDLEGRVFALENIVDMLVERLERLTQNPNA